MVMKMALIKLSGSQHKSKRQESEAGSSCMEVQLIGELECIIYVYDIIKQQINEDITGPIF